MKLNDSDIEHLASLVRLDVNEQEKEQFSNALNAFFDFAAKLDELQTEGVEPTTHGLSQHNVMREDEVGESLPLEKVFLNAPDEEDGQFKVPAVLE